MDEKKNPNWHHQITLIDREEMTIDGVINLGSFDDQEIVLDTDHGVLTIKGEELNIKQLNLEKGNIVIEGLVKSLVYDDDPKSGKRGKGFLGRLLK